MSKDEKIGAEISVGGIKAWVYQRTQKGVRSGCYYLKGNVPGGGEFFRSTGYDVKHMALAAAKKLWKARLDGRFDIAYGSMARRSKQVAPLEMRQRIGGVIQAMINDVPSADVDALAALEGALLLPPKLRKFVGCASVIRNAKAPAVYLLVKDGIVIYVGQSGNIYQRLTAHRSTRDFDTVYIFAVPAEDLNRVERGLIATFPDCENRDSGRTAPNFPGSARFRPNSDNQGKPEDQAG